MNKTKKNLSLLIGVTVLLTAFTGCKNKKDDDDKDDPKPSVTINIMEPMDGAEYGLNDTVFIKGSIESEATLHGYELTLTNSADPDQPVLEKHEHAHHMHLHVDTFWINDVTTHSTMELNLSVFVDHDGTEESKKISFHCHPM